MKYEKIKYPDGQISVKVTGFVGPSEIKERINSYEDLFFLRAVADAAKSTNQERPLYLTIPCLFGQRSDRRFEFGQSFDLKLIAETINAAGFARVSILDPHSESALLLIKNSERIKPDQYIVDSLYNIDRAFEREKEDNIVLVSPDAGAYKKVFDFAQEVNLPVVAAVKHRDLQGKIDLQFMGDVKGKECLIVDDLCDGGYTFIVLAKKLKEQGASKVYLYVTHAYFSKGLDVLKESIDHVFCTNSVKDVEDSFVTQYKVI